MHLHVSCKYATLSSCVCTSLTSRMSRACESRPFLDLTLLVSHSFIFACTTSSPIPRQPASYCLFRPLSWHGATLYLRRATDVSVQVVKCLRYFYLEAIACSSCSYSQLWLASAFSDLAFAGIVAQTY